MFNAVVVASLCRSVGCGRWGPCGRPGSPPQVPIDRQLIRSAHLQNTYENPFIGILTLIFGMRVFLKFMRFMLVHTERHSCDFYFVFGKFCFLCVDTVTLVCIFELGLRVASHSKTEYGSTATGMLIIIVMSGAFLHTVIDQAKNKH